MFNERSGEPIPPNDQFDLDRLRLSQDFAEEIGVKKAIVTVPVRKPNRQSFIRIHPDQSWRLETAVLELKDERETFLVEPELWPDLMGEIVPKVLFTAITRQRVVFLWPVRLPGADGRIDEWNRSALEAAHLAIDGWVRVAANMSLGGYEVYQASADLPKPEWPDIGFRGLLEVAFKDRFIRTVDHPVIRRLRGEF
jgi:hypothetical protein